MPAARTWTEDRITRLRQLHAEGYSASQIAAELGGITRNAVIGKVNRLGLPRPTPAPGVNKIKKRKRGGQQLCHFDPTTTKPSPKPRDEDTPLEQRKQLLELRHWHCKYPIGHPGEPNFFFCGAEVFGRSYCVEHSHLCYRPAPVNITHEERVRRHFLALRNIERIKRGAATFFWRPA
jgi:GcrA cell cycle regulator